MLKGRSYRRRNLVELEAGTEAVHGKCKIIIAVKVIKEIFQTIYSVGLDC